MKNDERSNQPQPEVVSALEHVAGLARELCRPDYSEVDNAIGGYLLEIIEPVMPERAGQQRSRQPKTVTLLARLLRLFSKPQTTDDESPIIPAQTELRIGKVAACDLSLADEDGTTLAATYDAGERGTSIAVH
jgi:hypothetical protein